MVKSFTGKKVLLMGLGLHGGALAVATWLLQQGAELTITDVKNKIQLKSSLQKLKKLKNYKRIQFSLGGHRLGDFIEQDLIIQNPGVPKSSVYLSIARQLNIPIVNEAVMFFGLYPGKKIGVTGTRGKSTTATLIHQLLKTKIKHNILAGNIATTPMFAVIDKIKSNTWPVLELSSWQLENLDEYRKSPQIAVITNVLVDHLNRYKNFKEYAQAKLAITKWQLKTDQVVLNYDNLVTRQMAKKTKAQVYWFSLKKSVSQGAYMAKGEIYFADHNQVVKIMPVAQVAMLGEHNLANALASIIVAKLLGVSNANIQKVLAKFSGIDYRLQYVGQVKGRAVYNDSTATTPDATQAALQALVGKKILLIAGGQDKELDYKNLAKQIKEQVVYLILLSGTGSDKLLAELKKINFPQSKLKSNLPSLGSAWHLARQSKQVDCILFSPAATSFNMFVHEFDRARQFDKLVHADQKK